MIDGPSPSSDLDEARELISALCDGQLDEAQGWRLRQLLESSAEIRGLYLRMMHQEAALSCNFAFYQPSLATEPSGPSDLNETMVMPAIRSANLAGWPVEESLPSPPNYEFPTPAKPNRHRAWSMAATVLIVAGIATLLLHGRGPKPLAQAPAPHRTETALPPPPPLLPPPIATLTRSIGAQWAGGAKPAEGQGFPEHARLTLSSGFVELAYGNGVHVVIEAPADLTLQSPDAVYVWSGRLSATVPPQAKGFTVYSRESAVIDLGTEFGFWVGSSGTTQVDVFKGKVIAQAADINSQRLVLTEGKAAKVSDVGLELDPRGANPQRFVRHLATDVSALDLVDLIAGGDGTTHRRGVAIEPLTGKSGTLEPAKYTNDDGIYHRVEDLLVVDGCFIPNGQWGAEQIDSAGHRFAFPLTDGRSFNHIWAGGVIPWPEDPNAPFSPRLGGVDYSQNDHAMLMMHSNKGLTLDLAAIRRLHPANALRAFRALAGNTFPQTTAPKDWTPPKADVFILVDGQPRFQRRGFTPVDGAIPVSIPLHETDRFLTLATTDGGDGINLDWIILADPQLDLKAGTHHGDTEKGN